MRARTADHHRRPAYESNLALGLWTRYERTGQIAALHDAIGSARRAVAATPEDHPDLLRYRTNLGLVLWTLAAREPGTGALDESVTVLRTVLTVCPAGHAERARFAANLSNALWARYQRGRRPGDLTDAVEAAQTAFDLTAGPHVDHATHAGNLGVLLLERHRLGTTGGDRDQAVHLLRTALTAPSAKDFDAALHRQNLAEAIAEDPAASEVDLAEARALAGQAARSDRAPVRLRIDATRLAARIARSSADAPGAAAYLTTAVDLLPELLAAPLDRSDEEYLLGTVRGVATEAAAAYLATGDAAGACAMLEQGRGVLLRAVTDPGADLRQVRAAAPDLADQLAVTVAPAPTPARSRTDSRTELLAEIRHHSGLTDVLRAPAPVALRADFDGPVVVVNVADHRSDALIVTASTIDVVPLPGLDPATAAHHAGRVHRAVHDHVHAGRSAARAAERDLDAVLAGALAWLADTVTGPVLDRLPHPPRRLWWSPTGPLTALPLHAATEWTAGTVMSYTTTLRALATTRTGRPAAGPVLIVNAADDLPSAAREVAAVTAHHRGAVVLSGPMATRAAVTAAFQESTIAHVCAHGWADPVWPSRGHLELADHDLTVDEISRLDLSRVWLTYLSACSTGRGSDLLPDEFLTLATAVGVAGCPHVVAGLWHVADDVATDVAQLFHAALAHGAGPADALHQAVTSLRTAHPGRPSLWTPFIHIGP